MSTVIGNNRVRLTVIFISVFHHQPGTLNDNDYDHNRDSLTIIFDDDL